MTFCFGENLELEGTLVILMTCTYFIQYLRYACETFKDSAGLFYKDRFVSLIASALNIGLSIGLSYLIGINGVVVATLVIVVFIYMPVDSYITYKYMFDKEFFSDILYKAIVAASFVGAVFLMRLIKFSFDSLIITILVNGLISVGVSLGFVLVLQLPWIKFNVKALKFVVFKRGTIDDLHEPMLIVNKNQLS